MARVEVRTTRRCARTAGGSSRSSSRSILTAFIIYSTWAAFQNRYYYVGADLHRDLISPFYSPCIGRLCVPGVQGRLRLQLVARLSPALLILIFPLGFRLTCYYYRRSYYRAFWWSAAGLRRRRRPRQLHRRDALPADHAEPAPLLLLRRSRAST